MNDYARCSDNTQAGQPGECKLRPHGSFGGERWEITPARARSWVAHRFAEFRGDSDLFRRLGPLDADEFALLLFDLDCYEGLWNRYHAGRGPKPPAAHKYLLPGREHWGAAARIGPSTGPAVRCGDASG